MASEEDSYGPLTLKGTPVADLKVNDIKKELDKRGLSKAGSKTQLVERLKAQMLLEKLQQDAAQSSGDELEGKVPNMALQQEQAGQSEFVRQYLEQQQRNLEKQMEVKKQVEEERKRKSADESSADESSVLQGLGKPTVDPEVTSPKKFKDDNSNAPVTVEPKMPRPARKSSRNTSKGENGQEVVAAKEKSRSPSPERESLRERTRSGSSSSSGSVTPETSGRRGRSTRGARGGRRGGRRGAAARKTTRKQSRSSSHSSTEEETMPRKRSSRATNSISSRSRSRSRSPSNKEAALVTQGTRRSNRRSSTVVTPTAKASEEEESGISEKVESKSGEPCIDAVKGSIRSPEEKTIERALRRSVEVLEPHAASIEKIETVEQKNSDDGSLNSEKLEQYGAFEDASKSAKESPDIKDDKGEQIDSESKPQSVKKLSRWKSSRSKDPKAHVDSQVPQKDTCQESSGGVEKESLAAETTLENKPTSEGDQPQLEIKSPSQASSDTSSSLGLGKLEKSGQSREADNDEDKEKETSGKTDTITEETESDSGNKQIATGVNKKQEEGITRKTGSPSESSEEKKNSDRPAEARDPDKDDTLEAVKDVKSKQTRVLAMKADAGEMDSHTQEHGNEQDKELLSKKNEDVESVEAPQTDSKDIKISSIAEDTSKGQSEKSDVPSEEKPTLETADSQAKQDMKTQEEESLSKKDKTSKKRKWGSKSSKTSVPTTKKPTSIEISSDSLKNLIGEVKISETVFDMETEVVNMLDYDEQEEDKRDVKVKRTVMQDLQASPMSDQEEEEDARQVKATESIAADDDDGLTGEGKAAEEVKQTEETSHTENGESQTEHSRKVTKPVAGATTKEPLKKKIKESKKVKKKKGAVETTELKEEIVEEKNKAVPPKMVATTRSSKPLLPMVDEPERVGKELSPSRHPPDRVLRIAGLVRPFTLGQLKELLKRTGELDEEHFWINDIKSHCLAAFKSEEDAIKTRAALHGARWPQSNPKILIVDFATLEDLQHRKSGGQGPPPALLKKAQEEKPKEDVKKAKVDTRRDSGKDEMRREATTRGKEDRDRDSARDSRRRPSPSREKAGRREPDQRAPPQMREWDKDKMKQPSRSRSPSKEKERPAKRSRSRDREQRRKREHSRDGKEEDRRKEKKQKDSKADEEPPAKLLDDLFRKTKATPCIYWLPLTEEQAQQRAIQREEREKEKQKRIAAAEEKGKEELKKREAARLERQKQRERERSPVRNRDRSRDRDRGRAGRQRPSRSRSRSRRR